MKSVSQNIGHILLLASCFVFTSAFATEDTQANKKAAQQLAQSSLIIDTHIDVPYRLVEDYEDISQATKRGDFDFPRAKKGGLNAPFMSIYIPAEYQKGGAKKLALELINKMNKVIEASPNQFAQAMQPEDIEQQFSEGKLSFVYGMENGASIENDIANLKLFYQKGVRYITLTHSKVNHISDSSYDKNRRWKGLSPFGKQLIGEMNNIGMLIDISHVSDDAFYQVMELTNTPVIASHSSARHFTPGFERNMSDEMIKVLAEKGGVIQINFGSGFLTTKARRWSDKSKRAQSTFDSYHSDEKSRAAFAKEYREQNPYPYATVSDVLDHIDHVVRLVGIDHVGIGSDYDGVGDSLPRGLEDVSKFPNLIEGLMDRGYSEQDIKKILAGNIMRVWREVNDYAANIAKAN